MKKIPIFSLMTVVVGVFFISACNYPAASSTPTQSPPTQPATAAATQPVPAATVIPAQQTFAPACAPCAAPVAADTVPNQTYCVKKIPYQNFDAEPGTTFESLDPSGELQCTDSGIVRIVNGRGLKIWTCTGKQLWTSELKITSPACSSRMILEFNTSHCQTGFGYSAAQNCCAPLANGNSASVIIKVNMGACQ